MSSISVWAVALLAAGCATGCAVEGRTAPIGYAEVYSGSPYGYYDYDYYPHTFYGGRTVYWYGNRWMYPDGGRWYAYQYEPQELYRYRTTVRQAPPAPRYYDRGGPRYYTPAQPGVGGYPQAGPGGSPGGVPPGVRVR
jgi:hypothetical protein